MRAKVTERERKSKGRKERWGCGMRGEGCETKREGKTKG